MDLPSALDAINQSKVNLIRNSDSPEAAAKLYPAYPVQRCMALHQDTVLYANELNIRGLNSFGLTNRMQFEFFLHAVTKKKRFAKWDKPEKDEILDRIKEIYCVSTVKAREIVSVLTEEQVNGLISKYEATGGEVKGRSHNKKKDGVKGDINKGANS